VRVRRLALVAAAAAALTAGTLAAVPIAGAATPRASLTDVENDTMCVACNESLAVAQAPEADQERAVIRSLIAQGLDKSQIEHQLVIQYGSAVLARPPAHGFNLTVYVLPPAILLAGLVMLALTLPRWRRRGRRAAASGTVATGPPLSPLDAERLDDELSRFPG
jgi:cytochrome c-type biogenesis protein CcmH